MSVLETSVNSKDLILQDMSHYVEIYDILVFKATRFRSWISKKLRSVFRMSNF